MEMSRRGFGTLATGFLGGLAGCAESDREAADKSNNGEDVMPPFDVADAFSRQHYQPQNMGTETFSGGDAGVEKSGGTYYMAVVSDGGAGAAVHYSDDPAALSWNSYGTVATNTEMGYDGEYVTDPDILEVDGTWYLFSSAGGPGNDANTQDIVVGTASSPGGPYSNWQSTGVVADSGYRSAGVSEPDCGYDRVNERFVLSFTAADDASSQSIGIATSTDGLNYTSLSENPVISVGPNNVSSVEDQCINCRDGKFTMYFNEQDGTVGISKAISTDLVNWTKVNNPILNPLSDNRESNGMFAPAIWIERESDVAHLWWTSFTSTSGANIRGYATGEVDSRASRVKQYDGTAWDERPLYHRESGVWKRGEAVRSYDGSQFVETPPGDATATAPPSGLATIPASATHRYQILRGGRGEVLDVIGSAHGQINFADTDAPGGIWNGGLWSGGVALNGDGTDDEVVLSPLGDFGSSMSTGVAVAFTVQTTATSFESPMGYEGPTDTNGTAFRTGMNSSGYPTLLISDVNGSYSVIIGDGAQINDGSKHRVVMEVDGPRAADMAIHIDGSEIATTVNADDATDNFQNLAGAMVLLARSTQGDVKNNWSGDLDDVVFFESTLSASQIADDYNRQPWV